MSIGNALRPLPRLRLLAVVGAFVIVGGCGEPARIRQMHKASLVDALSEELLRSVEAEKSAVLATTDEESKRFADESRRHMNEMQRLSDTLHEQVVADGRAAELEKLKAFDEAWTEMRQVDERLLALAVANSNLKAARLAAGDGAAAADRLVDLLVEQASHGDDPVEARRLFTAAVSVLRIQTSLAPHITSASDEEMTGIEARIRELSRQIGEVLNGIRNPTADEAWAAYRRSIDEVLRLSRLNTNVVSIDVSLHEKRHLTESCCAALAALRDEIRSSVASTR